MPIARANAVAVTVSVQKWQSDALTDAIERTGLSRSAIVQMALNDYFADYLRRLQGK